ncbi:hypothetical protein, partial [Hymenobacter rubidus]|uniref:hypothetical protein n=1 Tax=Hymenobacter rubidus TaxID=1441626 RepID=UPI00191F4BF2
WLGRPGHAPRKPPPPAVGPVAAYVVRELGLTRQQQQQYEALRQQHQARMRQLMPALMARREALFASLGHPAATAEPRLLDQIAALERRIDSLTYAHFGEVGRLVTPAQQARWQQMAPTLPRMMQQQGPGGRRGRREGPPGQGPPPDAGMEPPQEMPPERGMR